MCHSEDTYQIVLLTSTPVVGCLLKKGLQKGNRGGGHGHLTIQWTLDNKTNRVMRQIVPWFLRFSLIFFCMRELRSGEHELQSDEIEKPLPDSCLPLREKKKKKKKKARKTS